MVRSTGPMLAQWGFFDVLLPFVLIFALVYAILQKTQVLGKDEKAKTYNLIVALVMGFATIVPHWLYGTADPVDRVLQNGFIDLVEVINMALPQVSVLLVAILMVMLIFGIWGSKIKIGESSLSGIIALLSFLAVIVIFGNAAGVWSLSYIIPNIGFYLTPETQALIVTVLVFAIIIWFVTREPGKKEKTDESRFGKFMGSVLKDADE